MEKLSLSEKIKSCLLAGALGDAYGSRFQNMDVPTRGETWEFSDDTQLTVATCEALMRAEGPDPAVIADTFLAWYKLGQVNGVGPTTLRALINLGEGRSHKRSGVDGDSAANNGAAMRIAPLAFLLDPHQPEEKKLLRTICRITHRNEEAYSAALATVLAIRYIQNGRQNFLSRIISALPEGRLKVRLAEIQTVSSVSLRELGRSYGSGSDVVQSIPLALHAALQATERGLEPVFREISALGGDTDTISSIAGQIAGAYLGPAGLPPSWHEKMRAALWYDEYHDVFRRFADFVNQYAGIRTLF